jgi:hypothetical protein
MSARAEGKLGPDVPVMCFCNPRLRTLCKGKGKGGWVGPRTGLDDVEKRKFLILPGLELRPLGRPARSHSLYRPRYPCSLQNFVNSIKICLEV